MRPAAGITRATGKRPLPGLRPVGCLRKLLRRSLRNLPGTIGAAVAVDSAGVDVVVATVDGFKRLFSHYYGYGAEGCRPVSTG